MACKKMSNRLVKGKYEQICICQSEKSRLDIDGSLHIPCYYSLDEKQPILTQPCFETYTMFYWLLKGIKGRRRGLKDNGRR